MLAGIYYGAMYGGSTTSILMNIPGEAASIVTCLDGYQMTLKGRGGAALSHQRLGILDRGSLSVLGLMLMAPFLADVAMKFGPPEMFAVLLMALILLGSLGKGSFFKTMPVVLVGLLIGTIGMDPMTGALRFTHGITELYDGIGLLARRDGGDGGRGGPYRLRRKPPPDRAQGEAPGTVPDPGGTPCLLGTDLPRIGAGFLHRPAAGGAHVLASFVSYITEKRLAKGPRSSGPAASKASPAPRPPTMRLRAGR